jgi:subtilisin family serine protease
MEDEEMNIRGRRYQKKYCLPILFILIFICLYWNSAQSKESLFLKEGKKIHPKIESFLSDLQEKHVLEGRVLSKSFAQRHNIKMDEQDRVVVFLYPEAGKSKDSINIETLKAYGCEVIKSGDAVIKSKVPISMLDVIADQVEGVSFIKLPDRPLADVVSEGVSITGASTYHSAGYAGENVKVAIIDLGFAGLSATISSGELPTSVIKLDCTGIDCAPTDFPSEEEAHGTAVAEIVHDMAPSAQLYLMKVGDRLDLKNAKDYCIANGIKVINHSVGWFNSNFYDGACYFDNSVCMANHAYQNGILWVNAAGNAAKNHFEATYTDADGDGLHDVTSDSNYITINADAGDLFVAHLTWDAWPATNQDYDLLLYNSSNVLVAAGMNWQTGTQTPTESIGYIVPASGVYYLAVKKYNATSNHRFQIFTFYHDLNPYVASSSLASPADATGVMTVAAIDWANWTTGPQEYYSSQGPTTDGRIKPEVSGPDKNSSYTYGGIFPGTSAAAPHVAGAAALILSSQPTLTVSQLWEVITSSAIDMGASGQDNIYGYGRLNLPAFYPGITVFPTSVDFSDVIIGYGAVGTVTIQNSGNANLVIGSITSPSSPFEIIGDDCSGKTLPFGTECTLTIRFSPILAGLFNSSINIPSNDPQRNPAVSYLSGVGIHEIMLSSPMDQSSFDACSLYVPPTFKWNPKESFNSYSVQFSEDSTFSTIRVRIRVSGKTTEKTMSSSQWKRILRIPGDQGGTVYWRVVGTQAGGRSAISDSHSIMISAPQPVGNPILSPTSRMGLPNLMWQNNCNIKFKAWFGSTADFSEKKALSFHLSNPDLDGGTFSRELTTSQWKAIRRLVNDLTDSTIYWCVESQDPLKRPAITELMYFILTD